MKRCWFSVYLLHFPIPYGSGQRHYIGHTNHLVRRMREHRRKSWGRFHVARIVRARTRGAAMSIEYRWKRKGARSICPHCCK